MRIKYLGVGDAGQVYDSFCSVAVAKGHEHTRNSGFYDYPLTEDDFRARLSCRGLSISLEEQGKLIAYALAYPFSFVPDLDVGHDAVLKRVSADPRAVYFDQLFLKPGFPAFIQGRFIDVWTALAQEKNSAGVVTAIPQKPWKNVPSTRLAILAGFSRRATVSGGGIELGVFAKPFWRVGSVSDISVKLKGGEGK